MTRKLAWLAVLPLAAVMAAGVAGTAAAQSPGSQLGGISVAAYCQQNDPSDPSGATTLVKGGITGPDFAYSNFACADIGGGTQVLAATGNFPSFYQACTEQYPGIATYTYPSDPNDAYTWNCYVKPTTYGTSPAALRAAAVTALMDTSPVQAEVSALQALRSNPVKFFRAEAVWLRSQATQQLIADVLGSYGLTGAANQDITTVLLGAAVLRAAV